MSVIGAGFMFLQKVRSHVKEKKNANESFEEQMRRQEKDVVKF